MAYLPAILVRNEEELFSKLNRIPTNIDTFVEQTGQDHYALHVDVILPDFALAHKAETTYDYQKMLLVIVEKFQGQSLRLNIHLMGEHHESHQAAQWILSTLSDIKVYGEIYLPFFAYTDFVVAEHTNWLVGEWYDKGLWNTKTEFQSAEVLLMTVTAGYAGQSSDEVLQSQALLVADAHPEYCFILDGGWKKEFNPPEFNRELAINSDYWKSL